MLDQLIQQALRRAGSASSFSLQRPRHNDWQAIVHRLAAEVTPEADLYVTGYGDSPEDAVRELLADPVLAA